MHLRKGRTSPEDWTFTEVTEGRYAAIYNRMMEGQFSPDDFRGMTRSDLVYICGHTMAYPGLDHLRQTKVIGNATRAAQELERRRAVSQVLAVFAAAFIGAVFALAGVLIGQEPPQVKVNVPEQTTVTTQP